VVTPMVALWWITFPALCIGALLSQVVSLLA
jgi:hypothetical protein